ncbi:GNAT family N-acetyltransferase [Streptomyces litchfieldiae]|uniref:GNAT family N-acetyltransferase n=1 Tax=Streptomyces litchfieldiae TaxID=3075543 RepID=A0ABU2MYW6_9ACTN|nr:GNAT family N-acetyltransferase [Streptomyces sp. DSM 44938]MDT0346468.1 GNAT family N-acetyltransferase [Streptomyces sp. DSM 44938]
MHIRTATADDADFLISMLLEAFNWSGDQGFTREQIMTAPDIAHYVAGWPRAGDFGVIAEDEATGERAGAAWARLMPADDPGYGFVAPDVPEITIAVAPEYRGRGVGRALLDALLAAAADAGLTRLSLSVDDGNPARRLYRSRGFTKVGREGDSDTMLLHLT